MQIVMKKLDEEEAMAIIDIRQQEETPCILEFERFDGTIVEFANLQLCSPDLQMIGGQIIINTPDGTVVPPENTTIDARETPFTPPVRTGDTICDAAANAANVFQLLHSRVVETITVPSEFSIVLAIGGLLLAILFMPVALAVIIAILGTGLGIAFFAVITTLPPAAFNSNILCQLRTIFEEWATDDAGVVTFDYVEILADLEERSDSNIWTCLHFYLTVISENGLNRAGATTAIVGADCTACSWCYEWTTLADMALDGWAYDINQPNSKYLVYLNQTIDITDAEIGWTATDTSAGSAVGLWRNRTYGTSNIALCTPLSGCANPYLWSGTEQANELVISCNSPSGTNTLTGLKLSGTGIMPAWSHGTGC